MADDVVDLHAAYRRQESTLKSGRVSQKNYRVDFKADGLLVATDARRLNDQITQLHANLIREEIRAVPVPASSATLERRRRYERGKDTESYRKRYTGGRIGETAPKGLVRALNDSGRLADNLVIRPRRRSGGEAVATLNVPGNRLDPRTGDARHGRNNVMDNVMPLLERYVPSMRGEYRGESARIVKSIYKELQIAGIAKSKEQLAVQQAKLRAIKMRILGMLGRAAGIGL